MFCLSNYGKGKLALVPVTSNLAVVPQSKIADAPNTLFCKVGGGPKNQVVVLNSMSDPNTIIPAWFMRGEEDHAKANMKLRTQSKTVTAGRSTYTFEIPVYYNTKPLKRGDEVIYERQASSKTPRVSGCVVFTSASSEPEVKKPRIK